MPISRATFLFVLLTLCTVATTAHADPTRSKLGFDVRGFKPNVHNNFGWLAGIRWNSYFGDSEVYWGIAGYYGSPQGGPPTTEHMVIGGLNVGYEYTLGKHTFIEGELLLGYGQGRIADINIDEKSYYVVQPGLASGFRLGGGWRIAMTTHYTHMNRATDFSGFAIGLRFEFKSSSNSKPLNN